MTTRYQELDVRQTRYGELVLRRRSAPDGGEGEVYEVKLNDEFLMSSLVTGSEVLLARWGLEGFRHGDLEVAVGGLGLGFTAAAVLDHPGVASMVVVEALAPVIEWHRRGLVPLGERLSADPRCRFIHGDFFALAGPGGDGLDPENPHRRFDAILVDIDHAPGSLLHSDHAPFYRVEGLRSLAVRLKPNGVFALWSCDPPEAEFLENLRHAFDAADAREVEFENPSTGEDESNTVYLARG